MPLIRHRTHPRRLRTVLLAGMLVPVLGACLLAAGAIGSRWAERKAFRQLGDAGESIGSLIDAVAAITEEQARTSVLVIGASVDLGVPGDTADALAQVREVVDRAADGPDAPTLAPALRELRAMRRAYDEGSLGFDRVSRSYVTVHRHLADALDAELAHIDALADRGSQPAWLRARLGTLRESVAAVVPLTRRVRASLHVDLGDRDPAMVTDLLRSNAAFHEAVTRAAPEAGTLAEDAWHTFETDPAAVRLEEHLARSELVALGAEPSPYTEDLEALTVALTDGTRWAVLIADAARAAAADVEVAAREQAHDDERSVALWVAAALFVVAGATTATAVTARRLTAPVEGLATASRRIASGDLAGDPVQPAGPRELVETVDAFNDMAATLAAVERSAIALASDPQRTPAAPLPGRTGRALQAALDLLRSAIAEVEQQRAELAELASHDELTGLRNRRAAFDSIEGDLARCRRDGRRLALLYVDLDGFKSLNDRHGHAIGDTALRTIARAIGSTVRDGDLVARIGGDEFVITTVVDASFARTVQSLVERVRAAVRSSVVGTPEGTVPVSCSVGVAFADGTSTPTDLLARADRALYEAKGAGRDRAVWAGSDPLRGSGPPTA